MINYRKFLENLKSDLTPESLSRNLNTWKDMYSFRSIEFFPKNKISK
jgi:hypothetical protein